MKYLAISALALSLGTGSAMAQSVNPCDWAASAQAIVEPWEANSRTFSNGKTRLALLDTIEPAAGALHILVLSPPYDELGGRQCRVISASPGIGYAGISFDRLTAGYDPSVGLMFDVPIGLYDPGTGGTRPALLSFTLNQATGAIDTYVHGGE
jgi:hypothetical protein